jgi:hypothetical protein
MLYAIINLGQIFYRRFGVPPSMRSTPPPLTKQQRIFINVLLLSAILIISMFLIMK